MYSARAFLGHICKATVHTSWSCSQCLTHKATVPNLLPRHWISLHPSYHIYNLWLTGVVCALLVLYHLPFHFKAFLNVDIHYLPISTVDLSLEIWSNAYSWCTMTGFHQVGFMFPASCSISLKLWAQCLIWREKRGKISGWFLGVMVAVAEALEICKY